MPTKWIFAQRLAQRTEPSLTDPKASCSFYQSCFVLTPSHPTCEQKVHPPPCLNHRLIHFEPSSLPPLPLLLFAHLEEEKEEDRKRASGFEACLTESLSRANDRPRAACRLKREGVSHSANGERADYCAKCSQLLFCTFKDFSSLSTTPNGKEAEIKGAATARGREGE